MLWFFGELFAVTPPDIDISQLRDLQAVIEDGSWVITDDGSVSLTTRHVAWQQSPCCFHISLYLCSYIFSKSVPLLLPPTQNKVPPSSCVTRRKKQSGRAAGLDSGRLGASLLQVHLGSEAVWGEFPLTFEEPLVRPAAERAVGLGREERGGLSSGSGSRAVRDWSRTGFSGVGRGRRKSVVLGVSNKEDKALFLSLVAKGKRP